jgi:hypothetical protein
MGAAQECAEEIPSGITCAPSGTALTAVSAATAGFDRLKFPSNPMTLARVVVRGPSGVPTSLREKTLTAFGFVNVAEKGGVALLFHFPISI